MNSTGDCCSEGTRAIVTGNATICEKTPVPEATTDDDKIYIIIGSVVGGVAVLITILVVVVCCCCRRRPEDPESGGIGDRRKRPVSQLLQVK